MEIMMKNSQGPSNFVTQLHSSGRSTFSLVSTKGECLGSSRIYRNEKERFAGIAMVRKYAYKAKVKMDAGGEISLY
ncbi:MAG: DUF1508 domain-containing protein [Chitinophagaceae bacterium]